MKKRYAVVLSVAGSDSSGGAGIQADIKTISANACYAATAITALTAQNTQGVQEIFDVPAKFVALQLDSVFSDLNIDAVKIGMLHRADIIEVLAEKLRHYQARNIVLDPVMLAKDASYLIEPDAIDALKYYLLPLATLVTPNLPEAFHLLGAENESVNALAQRLAERFGSNFLVKGGHGAGEEVQDIFYDVKLKKSFLFKHPRIHTLNTHGTGCTLSSAIAANLARGFNLMDAIANAQDYLYSALKAGSEYEIGKGKGPVQHFFALE
jgi:hydroxymethylpyrimidine/phosphomethylpyrimidine kinase